MTVYVDAVRNHGWSPLHSRKWGCHMFAADARELHDLATNLDVSRDSFHDIQKFPHYHLGIRQRAKALALGAIEATFDDVVTFVRLLVDDAKTKPNKRRYKRNKTSPRGRKPPKCAAQRNRS